MSENAEQLHVVEAAAPPSGAALWTSLNTAATAFVTAKASSDTANTNLQTAKTNLQTAKAALDAWFCTVLQTP